MKVKMKPKLKNYGKPRPVILMVIGDTLLYASTLITSYAIFEGNKTVGIISLLCGAGGFFFTKLYAAQTNTTKVEYETGQDEQGNEIENLTITENKSVNPKSQNHEN